jgi:glycosyltransferase involved in cell wall biosynthesis
MSAVGSNPLIDVVLPVYNGAHTIAESVASVLVQTVAGVRILVVDDGSTDDTPRLLKKLARADARVTILTKANGGIVDALNYGLVHATAPYVARQDSDDRSYPDRFARQLDVLRAHSDIVAVSGACVHIDKDGRPTGTTYRPPDTDQASYRTVPSTEPYLLHPFLMVRREAYQAVGGYRHAYHAEDTDLYWRLRRIGRLANLHVPMGEMRLHDKSVSNASVVNGRIMAISSQLAAISACRRDHGRPDLSFPKDALSRYSAAAKLESMIAIAERELDGDERRYFRAAVGVKLLELAATRAYEIDRDDCRFVRNVYGSLEPGRLRGRSILNWAYRATLIRFLRNRLFSEAWAFTSLLTLGRAVVLRFLRSPKPVSMGDRAASERS